MKQLRILAIESSCDETAAAVIAGGDTFFTGSRIKSGMTDTGPVILSNVVSSQVELHAKTGGVVPEVASRAHLESIIPVITEALLRAKFSLLATSYRLPATGHLDYQEAQQFLKNEITHIAVTAGPGLIGSLLVGFNAAKAIAYALGKPIIPINHIEGHIYSALCAESNNATMRQCNNRLAFPALALVVSGGHTSLILMKDHSQYELIGQTLDDAAGEAFDKVAKILDLGYPGGPQISKLASQFRDKFQNPNSKIQSYGTTFRLPRPLMNDGTFNFSFSGLKTAVLYEVRNRSKSGDCPLRGLSPDEKAEIAAEFEDAAVEVLVAKTIKATEKFKPKTIIVSGGVSANSQLRNEMAASVKRLAFSVNLSLPPLALTGDNAAMIGLAGYYHAISGETTTWDKINIDSNWELG